MHCQAVLGGLRQGYRDQDRQGSIVLLHPRDRVGVDPMQGNSIAPQQMEPLVRIPPKTSGGNEPPALSCG